MPWDNKNEGPWNNNNNPWGNNNNNNGWKGKKSADDLDKLMENFKKNFLLSFSKGPKSLYLLFNLIFSMVSKWFFIQSVQKNKGVVIRFGKYTSISSPGLNYHIPSPMKKLLKYL